MTYLVRTFYPRGLDAIFRALAHTYTAIEWFILTRVTMQSSRTLHKTPGVQENREDNSKGKPKNQPVEDEYTISSDPAPGTDLESSE